MIMIMNVLAWFLFSSSFVHTMIIEFEMSSLFEKLNEPYEVELVEFMK